MVTSSSEDRTSVSPSRFLLLDKINELHKVLVYVQKRPLRFSNIFFLLYWCQLVVSIAQLAPTWTIVEGLTINRPCALQHSLQSSRPCHPDVSCWVRAERNSGVTAVFTLALRCCCCTIIPSHFVIALHLPLRWKIKLLFGFELVTVPFAVTKCLPEQLKWGRILFG